MHGRIFKTFSVGQFTIIPNGEPAPDICGIPVVLGKKGAFGSGEHETTAACLELMPAIPGISGASALDLGTGTGILAIAAALLEAESVVALDLEWPAAVSCLENIRLNNIEHRVLTVCSELSAIASQSFDLVMANIYADILLLLAERLVELTRADGYLLLSGIPLQDKFDIVGRYSSLGCRVADSRIGEDFATFLMQKTS